MTANTESRFRYPRRPIWVRALNLLVHHAPLRPRYGHNSILMRRALRDDDMGCAPGGNACVREATRHDLEHLINHAEALPRSVYATRLAHGDRCFCLVAGSEVRRFNWVSHDRACVMRGFENGTGLFDVGGELVDETLRQATLRCIEIQKACPDLGLFQPDGRGARHGLVRR